MDNLCRFPYCIILCLPAWAFSSCEIINPEEEIPSYVHVGSIDLQVVSPSSQGSASSRITDCWVSVNGTTIGTFEMPATFPVLKQGKVRISIGPGIKKNGISATRTAYPMYEYYLNDTLTLFMDSVVSVTPVVRYKDEARFAWIEDFEDVVFSLDSGQNSTTHISRITEPSAVYEGLGSGKIALDEHHRSFKVITRDKIALPGLSTPVYLEADYKTGITLIVGIIPNTSSVSVEEPVIFLNPTLDAEGIMVWNKIYIELTSYVTSNINISTFQITFSAALPDGTGSAEVYFDNLKLVHL